MKILKQNQLDNAVEYLQQGKTLVFPTETSYGLGCDATNQKAVDKIFKIKGRTSDKPLLVAAHTIEMAKKYLVWNDLLEKLANKYWPGPLTIVGEYLSLRGADSDEAISRFCSDNKGIATSLSSFVPRNDNLADGVVSQDNTIAIRVTAHPLLSSIIEKLDRPLVATSANLADAGDIYSASEATKVFSGQNQKPDIIIDSGELPRRLPSTVVSAVGGQLKILRQGELVINI